MARHPCQQARHLQECNNRRSWKTWNVCPCYLGTKEPLKNRRLTARFLRSWVAGARPFRTLPGRPFAVAPLAGAPLSARPWGWRWGAVSVRSRYRAQVCCRTSAVLGASTACIQEPPANLGRVHLSFDPYRVQLVTSFMTFQEQLEVEESGSHIRLQVIRQVQACCPDETVMCGASVCFLRLCLANLRIVCSRYLCPW